MKQEDIIKAYRAIKNHENDKLPLKTSLALFKIKILLQPQFDFQVNEENKIIEKYQVQPEDKQFAFKDKETANAFMKEMGEKVQELGDLEVDLGEFSKWSLPADQDLNLSVSELEALEPFIEFI